MDTTIPILDWKDWRDGMRGPVKDFVSRLEAALIFPGFFGIVNHGIPESHISEALEVTQQTLQLGDSVLQKYHRPDLRCQVGYIPFGTEKSIGQKDPNAMAIWQMRFQWSKPYQERLFRIPNIFPAENPRFEKTNVELFRSFERFMKTFLLPLAQVLGTTREELLYHFMINDSVMRMLYYPSPSECARLRQGKPVGPRSGRHKDLNWLSFLLVCDGDLWIETTAGEMLQVLVPHKNVIVVNVGDMLEMYSNGRFTSRSHEVRWSERERVQIVYFLTPQLDLMLPDGTVPLQHLIKRVTDIGLAEQK